MFGFSDYNLTSDFVAVADAATVEIATQAGMVQTWAMSQDTTINFVNAGQFVALVITCDGTPRTITWGTGVHGYAATYVLTASKKHTFLFVYDGTEHVLVNQIVLS